MSTSHVVSASTPSSGTHRLTWSSCTTCEPTGVADPPIPVTGDPDADRLLAENPLALLIGMLLDQQVPMEWAFKGPATLRDRLGGLDARTIAAVGPDRLDEVFRAKPALHRYPGSM